MANGNGENKKYKVLNTQSASYFDKAGKPVNGYRLEVEFIELNEIHTFDVPSLNKDAIKAILDTFLTQRMELNNL